MTLAQELELDSPFSDIRHEAVLNVVHTANHLFAVGEALFRRFDVTHAQFNVLFALKYKQVELTQVALGKRLVVTRATITSLLDKLEQKELVERQDVPGNRRIFHVSLTGKGQKLIDELEPLYRNEIHQALKKLNTEDCRTLIRLLERVRASTSSMRAVPASEEI